MRGQIQGPETQGISRTNPGDGTVACRKDNSRGGHETVGYFLIHILQKGKGAEFIVSEISVFMFGFVITLAIICAAEVAFQVSRGK